MLITLIFSWKISVPIILTVLKLTLLLFIVPFFRELLSFKTFFWDTLYLLPPPFTIQSASQHSLKGNLFSHFQTISSVSAILFFRNIFVEGSHELSQPWSPPRGKMTGSNLRWKHFTRKWRKNPSDSQLFLISPLL